MSFLLGMVSGALIWAIRSASFWIAVPVALLCWVVWLLPATTLSLVRRRRELRSPGFFIKYVLVLRDAVTGRVLAPLIDRERTRPWPWPWEESEEEIRAYRWIDLV